MTGGFNLLETDSRIVSCCILGVTEFMECLVGWIRESSVVVFTVDKKMTYHPARKVRM